MAIADDFTVNLAGDIRHTSGTTNYTVIQLHRFLQGIADDEYPVTADDILDMTSLTPSERSTDQIITLINGYNIDDNAAQFLYGGSITQAGGDTVYSGLRVLGAVNDVNTQIQVIQDDDYYNTTTPFWGDQSTGGYNGDAVAGVLFRILVKSRVDGADVDGKRVRVQARAWGDTYDFFNVTLGLAESVAAIGTTPDAQNNLTLGTVQGWAGGDIPTNTEGFQAIDINNGNGPFNYYSRWTYNTNALAMKAIWNWIKEITGNDSPEAATPHGRNGETFLGVTHSWTFDAQVGTFTEDEIVTWGTDITYDNLVGGTFAVGDYVTFKRTGTIINAGKVLYDNGTTQMRVALEDLTTALADGDQIFQNPSGTVTADINVTITNGSSAGGEGVLLAFDDAGDAMYVQLIHGAAPVDNLPLRGRSSAATADVLNAPSSKTVPKVFLGSYTGSLIGAYGIGIDPDDLLSTDSVTPLVGATQIPPNNVTFSLSGLVSGEDRVLIMKKHASNSDFDFAEMTLAVALTGAAETSVDVGAGNVPADAPATGTLRVTLDDGRHRRVDYTAHNGNNAFTIASSSWVDPNDAGIGNGVSLAFIDKLSTAGTEEFTIQFNASRTLWIRVRDGGGTPIKTFESPGTLGSAGGSAVASRISDA